MVNLLSTRGIPLLREEQKVTWASDSLINSVISSDKPDEESLIASIPEKSTNEPVKENPQEITQSTPEIGNTASEPVRIDIETALKLYNKNIVFVDARPAEDFHEGHIKGAFNISYYSENLEEKLKIIDKEKPVVVYCTGSECDLSDMLSKKMFKLGYKKLFIFFGGWEEWSENNYPAETQELN